MPSYALFTAVETDKFKLETGKFKKYLLAGVARGGNGRSRFNSGKSTGTAGSQVPNMSFGGCRRVTVCTDLASGSVFPD